MLRKERQVDWAGEDSAPAVPNKGLWVADRVVDDLLAVPHN